MAELPEGAVRSVVDVRGQLVAVEHGLLPFEPRRTFVVTSDGAPVGRGGHVAGCRQLLVLVAGHAVVCTSRPDGSVHRIVLDESGSVVEVAPDDHVEYRFEQPGSVLLVLADQPFRARPESSASSGAD